MSKSNSGGQLPPMPDRKTGSPAKGGNSYGQVHTVPGGPGQGGSGSGRKGKK